MRGRATGLQLWLAAGASAGVFRGGLGCTDCKATSEWPGWKGIKQAFIFGDSYTSTSFNATGPAPSPSNPLGNPRYPGYTSSNGPNWVGFLTTKYNASALQTYNLADGGATVDSALVSQWKPTVRSMKQQVTEVFLPGYTGAAPTASQPPHWRGNDTLFALWIGINDVGNSWSQGAAATEALNAKIFAVYWDLLRQLHGAGARNFALLNVPPVNRSPLTIAAGPDAQEQEKKDLEAFNRDLEKMARVQLKGTLEGANVWLLDTYELFGKVLDDPKVYEATKGYKNVTAFCGGYENGTPNPDTFNATCGVPVNQYFWLNSLHPTYPMHDVVAQETAKMLSQEPNVHT